METNPLPTVPPGQAKRVPCAITEPVPCEDKATHLLLVNGVRTYLCKEHWMSHRGVHPHS